MLYNVLLVDVCVDCGLDKTQWTNTSRRHSTPNHHWLWKLHTGLQATWILCVSLFLQTLGPWFTNEMQHLLSSEKRTLDHWATVQFSLSQIRCFWWCLWFRSGLVALFLKMSERGDSWFSFSSLRVKLSQVFESALLDVFSSLLLVHIFLPNFFLPVNFAFNMLWYSTHWTAPPFSNDPLWLTLFVGGVNDRLLDHCQVSSVPHYCVSKNKRYPQCILYGWSFIETQM